MFNNFNIVQKAEKEKNKENKKEKEDNEASIVISPIKRKNIASLKKSNLRSQRIVPTKTQEDEELGEGATQENQEQKKKF